MFHRVVIVGPGLIGGSLGLALKQQGLAGRIIGVGHRQVSLNAALAMKAIDEGALDLDAAVPEADLVVLCVSVALICDQVRAVLPRMKPGAILTDVGSVKEAVCLAAAEVRKAHPNSGVHFVGAHPLAGSEQRGVQFARADLYRDALCVLTPLPDTDPQALAALRSLWEKVGARTLLCAPDRHDRILAEVSHLPHMAAACLVNAVPDESLALAATGFRDTTRVASGDPALWRDIALLNRRALAEAMRRFAREAEALADEIEHAQAQAILDRLAKAKMRRDRQLGRTVPVVLVDKA